MEYGVLRSVFGFYEWGLKSTSGYCHEYARIAGKYLGVRSTSVDLSLDLRSTAA